ncbi:formylglycine-generating enzyme family protein [Phycisphaera mikurensis]|uniref:Sulfatase-modifying factor enzyme-like domain-containing protein n=1 Tax=Phycisphaera mikurensis (strain NBRC 102666 / KCTC 22515 / FYK2301M01) TaxID=1142394 RepID=I0II23_PHYMF|nr:SUMF1/EgtB/PvdO family nonheme iron enzyme [Phycisphaera mikurensis]MBB6442525.1 formylglycine-generating enzyme required for sulfatase activity [Phycisphaera mikurensis]BAM04911.1 hypothetical protein PSMK_27520 [Phycisphaera mikurensis NBRC 102666]
MKTRERLRAGLATTAVSALALAWTLGSAPAAVAAVVIDWATVGNAGNAADTTRLGAVGYDYRVSKHEVTNAQYAAFLNAVAATDTNRLYKTIMAADRRGGITRSGSPGSFTYAVKADMGNKPVNHVNWFDAARFSNWMTNGQGSGSTETGVYTLRGRLVLATTRDTSDLSQVFLPNENEWYKAAYHQPSAEGGDSDGYWAYPTASNRRPTIARANATGDIRNAGVNVANYNSGADWNGLNGNVATVGSAGVGSESFYGTSDQGGNVWEWTESRLASNFILRGGSWSNFDLNMRSSNRILLSPSTANSQAGFRIASFIPEPASLALLAAGAPLVLRRRRD